MGYFIACRLAVCVALAASACTPVQQAATPAVVAEADCGVALVAQSRLGRPGVPRIRSGEAVRACTLPDASDLDFACESADAADGPSDRRVYPSYAISNAACAFTNSARTEARCSFDLAETGAAASRRETALTYRFVDLSDETVHDHLVTFWSAGASCRGAP
ncbi:MAG: hypothetical protein AB7O98_05740 [Hyphomonadaceae bacterium]